MFKLKNKLAIGKAEEKERNRKRERVYSERRKQAHFDQLRGRGAAAQQRTRLNFQCGVLPALAAV